MSKYYKSNRALERLILKSTGFLFLDQNDLRIIEFSKEIENKYGIPSRDLARQYRAKTHKFYNAITKMIENNWSIENTALSLSIKLKDAKIFLIEKQIWINKKTRELNK
jgi:hypothetical protein